MGIHTVMYYEEPDGMELVDIDYQCSRSCMLDTVWQHVGAPVTEYVGQLNIADGNTSVSWGAWPGGSETDYAVYCSGCGELLWEGMNE